MAQGDIIAKEGTYKIKQLGPVEEFSFEKDGKTITLKSYALLLDGVEDWVKLSQKPDSDAPKEGDELKGHVEDTGKYGLKFVKKRSGGSWGGGKGYSKGAAYSSALGHAIQALAGYYNLNKKVRDELSFSDFMTKVQATTPLMKELVDTLKDEGDDSEETDSEAGESEDQEITVEDIDEEEAKEDESDEAVSFDDID